MKVYFEITFVDIICYETTIPCFKLSFGFRFWISKLFYKFQTLWTLRLSAKQRRKDRSAYHTIFKLINLMIVNYRKGSLFHKHQTKQKIKYFQIFNLKNATFQVKFLHFFLNGWNSKFDTNGYIWIYILISWILNFQNVF